MKLNFLSKPKNFLSDSVSVPRSIFPKQKDPEAAGCGGLVTKRGAKGGYIMSPGFPGAYPKDVTCYWLIRVDPKNKIFVKIVELQLTTDQSNNS